jgi:hypothetical protein
MEELGGGGYGSGWGVVGDKPSTHLLTSRSGWAMMEEIFAVR